MKALDGKLQSNSEGSTDGQNEKHGEGANWEGDCDALGGSKGTT